MAKKESSAQDIWQRLREIAANESVRFFPDYRRKTFPGPDYNTLKPEEIKGIDVYVTDPQLIQSLSRDNAFSGEPIVQDDPEGGVVAKFSLERGLAEKLIKNEALQADIPLLHSADPYALFGLYRLKLPKNHRIALCPIEHHGEKTDALLIRTNTLNVQGIVELLKREGLVAPKNNNDYVFRNADNGEGIVFAVPLSASIAHAIRNTKENAVEALPDYPIELSATLSLQDAVDAAAKTLPAIERKKPDSSRKKKNDVEPVKAAAKKLEHYTDLLNTHIRSFERQRKLDGSYDYYVLIDAQDGNLVKQITSPDETQTPVTLRLFDDQDEQYRYGLSGRDYQLLKSLIPASKNLPDIERPATIAEQHLEPKFNPHRKTQARLTGLHFTATADGTHYLIVAGEDRNRLKKFLQSLNASQAPMQPQFITAEDETPSLLRLTVPPAIAEDITRQPLPDRIKKAIPITQDNKTAHADLSLLQEAMRDQYNVTRPDPTMDVPPISKPSAPLKAKPKTGNEAIDYDQQQEAEADFLGALNHLAHKQEKRGDVFCAAFANVIKTKTRHYTDKKDKDAFNRPKKKKNIQFDCVVPTLFVEVRETIYQQILQEDPNWHRISGINTRKQGDYRLLEITLSPDGMQKAQELLNTASLLDATGKPHALRFEDIKEGYGPWHEHFLTQQGNRFHNINQYFDQLKTEANALQDAAEKGFSESERETYYRVMQWRRGNSPSDRPTDDEIQFVDHKLAAYQRRKAENRALEEIASKELRVLTVQHLASEELDGLQASLDLTEGYAESISHISLLANTLKQKIDTLTKNSRIQAIHPDLAGKIEEIRNRLRSLTGNANELQQLLKEIDGQLLDYREYANSLPENRISRQVLLMHSTQRTEELLKALEDETYMMRPPIMLHNAMGENRDVVMLFPTDRMLQAIEDTLKLKTGPTTAAKKVQPSNSAPLAPEQILFHLRQEFTPNAAPARPVEGPKETIETIVNRLKAALHVTQPMLVKERIDNPYPNNSATEEIGVRHVLMFTVSGHRSKRDRSHIQNITETLNRHGLLLNPKRYGNLVEVSGAKTEAEKRILALLEATESIDQRLNYFNDMHYHVNKLAANAVDSQKDFHQGALTGKIPDLSAHLDACRTVCETLESYGLNVDCEAIDQLRTFTDLPVDTASAENWQTMLASLTKLREELRAIKSGPIHSALDPHDEVAERLKHNKTQLKVSVIAESGALLDAQSMVVGDLDNYHKVQSKDSYMLKLYVDETVWEEIARRQTNQKKPASDKILLPEEAHNLWATQHAKGSSRG